MPIVMINFFLSLKTAVWTLFGLVILFFIGSYMMPMHRDVFSSMNDGLLFDWVENVAFRSPWQTAWFFAALAGLVLLTINTLVCSWLSIKGKWSRQDLLLRLSPQIIHLGFLFILLAHLLGAGWGYRLSGTLPEGASAALPEDRAIYVRNISADVDGNGYLTDWSAAIYVMEKGVRVKVGLLGPNQPLFYKGVGFYLKSLSNEGRPMAHLMVNKDPGAIWALIGSVLFMLGSVTLLVLKWRRA